MAPISGADQRVKRAKAEVGADGMHEHLPDASVTWSDDSTLTMSPEVPIASGEARIARKRHSERSVVVVRGRTLGAE